MFVGRVVAASGHAFVLLLGSPGLDSGLDRHPFVLPLGQQQGCRVVQFVNVGFFDVWGPWSGAVGRARLMDEAAPLLLEPNCLVGKDGSVPMIVPWELGIVSRWDTHGWKAATPQVSMSAWMAWLVLRL